jgi:hypothetical protein
MRGARQDVDPDIASLIRAMLAPKHLAHAYRFHPTEQNHRPAKVATYNCDIGWKLDGVASVGWAERSEPTASP